MSLKDREGEAVGSPCSATQGLNQPLELPCIPAPAAYPLPRPLLGLGGEGAPSPPSCLRFGASRHRITRASTRMAFLSHQQGADPSPQAGKSRHSHTPQPGDGEPRPSPLSSPKRAPRAPPPPPPGTGTVPWDLGRAWERHLLAGIRGQGRGHALPGCLRGAGGRPRRLAAFPNDPESSAAKALSRDTSSQGTCSWPGAGMLP